jgi:hypothetical protein
MNGAMPCRADYACFTVCAGQDPCRPVCRPAAQSHCDPTVDGACGQGMGCIRTGVDNVGDCATACDLFAQDCDQSGGARGCFVLDDTGRGFCAPALANLTDGAPCQAANDCQPGLGCFHSGNTSVCRPFCGGPMNVLCTNARSCVDFSTSVKIAVAGACAG